jgi:two-component system, chemotaxis family, protein-glutamate methylesterase/glutaminase
MIMIKVLIVDDSAIVRRILSEELAAFPDIEVVGTAIDPYAAREQIVKLKPDVITLDIEMPRMDGLTFLEKLMRYHPIPVVVVSSLASENSENYLRALAMGAIEIVSKPGSRFTAPDVAKDLVRAIRTAAQARVVPSTPTPATKERAARTADDIHNTLDTTHKIIAIGASTGGTRALETVLTELPPNAPGTVIVQHMPENFTASFAKRLNEICSVDVREAKSGDAVVPGTVLIAPGGRHMLLKREGARYSVVLKDGPAVHFQRPSVDVLFESVARCAAKNATGVILTGMGCDGATGLLAMRESGSRTIAQDEQTCVVYGMPREAVRVGAAAEILPLDRIAQAVLT